MLIVLRGNSGSGKTTTAKLLRDKMLEKDKGQKIALIEEDYLRRIVLKEKREKPQLDNIGLIEQTINFCLSHGYHIILEGILWTKQYEIMLKTLHDDIENSYFYYFDIPLAETLKRHATKPNAHEFGEKEIRDWHHDKDFLKFVREKVITADQSQSEIIEMILSDTSAA